MNQGKPAIPLRIKKFFLPDDDFDDESDTIICWQFEAFVWGDFWLDTMSFPYLRILNIFYLQFLPTPTQLEPTPRCL